MRKYCYGLIQNTDSLAFTQVTQYGHPWQKFQLLLPVYQNIRTLFLTEAQVCPGPIGVHMRMQDIVLCDIWEDSRIQVDSRPYAMQLYEICRHTSLESKASDIESVYNGERSSFLYTCSRCNTVSLIGFRRIDSRIALTMTRWVNLGPGIHREDPLWKIHIYTCNDKTIPYEFPCSLMRQSPRTCFENAASLSFEDLRSCNISYLCGDKYKKGWSFAFDMTDVAWHISYKEPFKFKRWGISSLFA
jgi:hypothetical protein